MPSSSSRNFSSRCQRLCFLFVSAAKCEEKSSAENNDLNKNPLGVFYKFLEKPPKLTADEKFVKDLALQTESSGGRPHREDRDQRSHQAHFYPWASDRVPYHPPHDGHGDVAEDKHHVAPISVPAHGYQSQPRFESEWEKHLAYHHGLFNPAAFKPAKTLDEIRQEVENFTLKVHRDNPKDACKYLLLEEQKCLSQQQYEIDPPQASRKCLKWFGEWRQCKWDEEKMIRGHNYIESLPERKHRSVYSKPNYRYA